MYNNKYICCLFISLALTFAANLNQIPLLANDFSGLESSTLKPVTDDHGKWGMKIVFLDVGQADAILVFAPNGDVCLIDSEKVKTDGKKIYDYLNEKERNGIGKFKTIDLLFTTHYDQDHMGGIAEVVANGIKIGKAFDQGVSLRRTILTKGKNISEYGKYIKAVGDPNNNREEDVNESRFVRHTIQYDHTEWIGSNNNIKIRCVGVRGDTKGRKYDKDLDPSNKPGKYDENPGSIALVFRMGEFEFYTAGDQSDDCWKSKPNVETRIIKSKVIDGGNDIDVLKVSHHGSDTSSGKEFIQSLDPEIAIISTKYAKDELPKKITLKTLQDNNCYALITGDGRISPNGDYKKSSATNEDDNWDAFEDTISVYNKLGNITVLVSKDGSRYTVYGKSFKRTFSAKDEDNTH